MNILAIFNSSLHILAILGVIGSGIVFYIYGKRAAAENDLSVDGYLLSHREVSGKAFANTFTASTLSLASNIIFFIEAHKQYGFWMALCPMLYVAMQFWLLSFLKHANLPNDSYRTFADLWYRVFPSKLVTRYVTIISFLLAITSLFVEIYIGSIILSVFLPDVVIYKTISFFFLGMMVLGYVRLGGYKAIVKTDAWQLLLIILSCLAIGLFAYFSPVLNPLVPDAGTFKSLFKFQASGYDFYIFFIWVCVGNLCLCLTDASIWQRINAVRSIESALKGLKVGVWKIILVFFIPTLSFVYLAAKGYDFSNFSEFLAIVEQYSGNWGFIVYPIIVVGFGAALFSTADTMMIAAIYTISDGTTLIPLLSKIPAAKAKLVLRKYLSFAAVLLIVILSLLYYLQFQDLAKWFMPIMYTIWSQIGILAPLAVYGLLKMKQSQNPIPVSPVRNLLLISMLLIGSAIILYGAKQQANTGRHIYSQLAFLQAITITAIGTYLIMPKLSINKIKLNSKAGMAKEAT